MKNKPFLLTLIVVLFAFTSCETYPEYEIEYSPTYPLNGEYFVQHYNSSGQKVVNYYKITLYNTATGGKDSIWVDNRVGNGTGSFYKFKIKAHADIENRSFDQTEKSDAQTPTTFITLTNTKVIENNWPIADSIYMTVRYRTEAGTDSTFIIAGHRRTGFEEGTGWGQDQ